MEHVSQLVLGGAQRDGFEDGNPVAADAAALTTNIHSPTDSALLLDVIRVSAWFQVFAAESFVGVFFVEVGSEALRLHW